MSRMLGRESGISTSGFRDAKRGVDLDKFPSVRFFFQNTSHSDYQFFFYALPLETPNLARVEPGDGVTFLYVKILKFDGEVFCAGYVVTIIVRRVLTSFDEFVFISAYFGKVRRLRHKVDQLLGISCSECVKIGMYGLSSVQTSIS